MKRFLSLAAILFLCAACTAFPANAQNAPSNAVWVGVSVNVTNGTVSPPILEQRISTGGSGINTNDIVMKWPSWYQFGTNGDLPGEYSSGLFRTNKPNSGVTFTTLADVPSGYSGVLTIREGGLPQYGANWSALNLISSGLLNMEAYKFEAKATHASSGMTLTNAADNVFPVTWNGVTKNGWPQTNAFTEAQYDDQEEALMVLYNAPIRFVGGAYYAFNSGVVSAEAVEINDYLLFNDTSNTLESVNGELTWGGQPIGGGGGLSGARVVTTNSSVAPDDYLVWLDTRAFSASDSVTLTLTDMAGDSQTIVVRRLGNDGTATIARGTNTWTLGYDGDGVTVDWCGAATNWFWRSF